MGRRTHGRSAYLCPDRGCVDKALRRRALERSLSPRGQQRGSEQRTAKRTRERNGRAARVHAPQLQALWLQMEAALDQEIETLQRSGDISRSTRYDALRKLRGELRQPGRSA